MADHEPPPSLPAGPARGGRSEESLANQPHRVLVIRALKLGDLLCTVPAFRALRAALSGAEIRLVGLPWSHEFVARFDAYLDGLFVLPGFPGFPEAPFEARAFVRFLDDVHAWAPDLVIQLHGSGGLSNALAVMLGGRRAAGYYLPGAYRPDPATFIPYPDDVPEVCRHLRLLEHLGIPPHGLQKELPVHDADRQALADTLGGERLPPGSYAVVHAGASVLDRQWPPQRFAAVADALAERGLRIVLTGSPAEARIVAAVQHAMRAPAVDLAGRTSLGSLAALLADAALLVSNDTGVMHVAEGVGTPLVAVSFDPEGWRWAPQGVGRHVFLPGGQAVTVADILQAIDRHELLAPGTSGRPLPSG